MRQQSAIAGPVPSCPCYAAKVHPCSLFFTVFRPRLSILYRFFCLRLLCHFTVPCIIVFVKPEDLEMWQNHLTQCVNEVYHEQEAASCVSGISVHC